MEDARSLRVFCPEDQSNANCTNRAAGTFSELLGLAKIELGPPKIAKTSVHNEGVKWKKKAFLYPLRLVARKRPFWAFWKSNKSHLSQTRSCNRRSVSRVPPSSLTSAHFGFVLAPSLAIGLSLPECPSLSISSLPFRIRGIYPRASFWTR
jgi:hypothetical protein